MALLDFMKQGTQWLTDNTGMDWNTVQRDPGMAAKRLMGGPVDLNSQYQAQPTQDSLLGAPDEIAVAPEMQNRQTFVPNTEQPQPDMGAVHQYRNEEYDATDPALSRYFNQDESVTTRQKDYIPVSEGGYEEPTANAKVHAYDYANRQNAPMYDSDVMGKAQEMSLLNAADDTEMSQLNVEEIDKTIPAGNASQNTVFEQNNLAIADAIDAQAELHPDFASASNERKVSNNSSNNTSNDVSQLTPQQKYTVKMIMGSGNSNAQKAAALKKYGIDPSIFSIPGLITGK